MYALKESNLRNLSPKSHSGRIRPGTSLGFSLIDVNEKHVNTKGIKLPETYDYKNMHDIYGKYLKKQNTNDKRDFKKEYKDRISTARCSQRLDYQTVNPNLNNDYFNFYNNEYKRQLSEAHKINRFKPQVKDNKTFLQTEIPQMSQTQGNFFKNKIFNNDTDDKPNKATKPYTITSKSNSEWNSLSKDVSLLNHTSTKFHILNPLIKNISLTKNEIINQTEHNPIHRQKMLCEYIDVTRVGCPNPNKEYLKAYNKSNFSFNRTSDICTSFSDLHSREYKHLLKQPFKK